MSRIIWKENLIVSVKIREDCFVLAQLLRSPFLVFYNLYSKNNVWDNIELNNEHILFICSVARQFIVDSKIVKIDEISPILLDIDILIRIKSFAYGSREIIFQEGSEKEIRFLELGNKPGGSLIKEISSTGESHLVMENIPLDANDIIDKYELDAVRIYPELNERLYICYELGEAIDPLKDIVFDRYLPMNYRKYIQITSGLFSLNELGY